MGSEAVTRGAFAADRWLAILLTVAGVGGFLGLLVLGSWQTALADYARGLAVIWLIVHGLLRCQIDD